MAFPGRCLLRVTALAGALAGLPLPVAAQAGSAPAATPSPAAPVVREVVVRGARLYDRQRVMAIIRTRPGQALYRDAATAARALQNRYHVAGYPGAVVRATFDEATGTLALEVDEGVLAEVVVPGVDEDVAARVRGLVALPAGEPVQDKDIRKGLERMEEASSGALERGNPASTVEPGPTGARVVLDVVRRRARLALTPYGPGTAAVWNRVDGFAPWAAAELTAYDPVGFNHLHVYGRLGYGFSSHDPRWAAGAQKPLGRDRLVTLGYEYHGLTDTDDIFREVGFERSPTLVQGLPTYTDYFERRGHEAFLFVQPDERLQLGASFRADSYLSLASYESSLDPNPAVDEGDMRSLVFTVRAATGALWPSLRRERSSFLDRTLYGTRREGDQALRFDGTLEVSTPGLGGDFDFQRLILDARAVRRLGGRLEARGRGLLGLSWGDVPVQRQLELGGLGTLPARSFKELPGRHVGLVQAELAALPDRRLLPGVVGFYDGGVAWTPGATGAGWRSDLGLGVEWPSGNGFLLRVDAAWAVDPLPGQDRFRVSGRARLPF